MHIHGRIEPGTVNNFFRREHGGETISCTLYTTARHAGEEREEYDLSGNAVGPAIVTCDVDEGDTAWGVSDVASG